MNHLEFIEDFFEKRNPQKWRHEPSTEAYMGSLKGTYDFVWGVKGPCVPSKNGAFSIWRSPREFGRIDYWLKLDSASGSSAVRMGGNEYRRVCLAFDAGLNRPGTARIEKSPDTSYLSLDFPPPQREMRWICAVGGRWLGFSGGHVRWAIPDAAVDSVVRTLKRLWLRMEIGDQR
jgi:hypothetical protein